MTTLLRCASGPSGWIVLATIMIITMPPLPATAQQRRPIIPETASPSPAISAAIEAQWLTDAERQTLRIFHGVWDERDLTTPESRARIALNAWQLDDSVFEDGSVPAYLRAEAHLRAGRLHEAVEMLAGIGSNRAARIRAQALESLGEHDTAIQTVDGPVRELLNSRLDDPVQLTEGVRAMMIRSRLQGQPARDFQSMMNLLGRARQELDRLYWPAHLTEAQLLLDKDNVREAIASLHETLALNPRCAWAWYLLGQVAIDKFDFDSGAKAEAALRRIHRNHPLATLLETESSLVQNDSEAALALLEPLLERYPRMREALALLAAAHARHYDEQAMQVALDHYEQLSPGSALPYYVVGKQLAYDRQYELAAQMLEEARRRQPAWPAPQVELGLLELQSGRDDSARHALEEVAILDPFNKRSVNSLFLLEELSGYSQIETEHFIIRYKPGIDQVFAELMPEQLERIHETVARRFGHEPERKTVIEVLPDHTRFGVRITGMPFIHTIAACTGPVIAMEVPRAGKKSEHLGLFDWPRVLQHEYTHTITLSQTRNRIPHWLTEAAAVSMEPAPRAYDKCQMLARAYQMGELFHLDEINWAFIRPKKPHHRSLAYAQGHWMVQYMDQRFGESALLRLLEQYFDGVPEKQAIPNALGVTGDVFMNGFLDWAGLEVKAWGLAAEPTVIELQDEVRRADPKMAEKMRISQQARLDVIVSELTKRIGQPGPGKHDPIRAEDWPGLIRPPLDITDEMLTTWLVDYPDHPDLHLLRLRRYINNHGEDPADEKLIDMLRRYGELRPVDPYPHKKLAKLAGIAGDIELEIEALEFLDVRQEKKPVFAFRLAELYYAQDQLELALGKIMRAVNIDAYSASTRELAASLALKNGDLTLARQHIVALTILEPDRPKHHKRLTAIDRLLEQSDP